MRTLTTRVFQRLFGTRKRLLLAQAGALIIAIVMGLAAGYHYVTHGGMIARQEPWQHLFFPATGNPVAGEEGPTS
jgi:hypothetical protein